MPSQNYTLTRVTSGEQDLVWDDASGAYVKYVPPVEKPEQLYAYTEESISRYAWTVSDSDTIEPEAARTLYTTTPILEEGAIFYDKDGEEYVDGTMLSIWNVNGAGEAYVTAKNEEYIEIVGIGPL